MNPVEAIVGRIEHKRRQTDGSWMVRCPAHEDREASLHVSEGRDGKALLKCHAGCHYKDIVDRLGIDEQDLFPDREPKSASKKSRLVATYSYTDESGQLLHQTVRYEPKRFMQRQPGAEGGQWIYNLKGVETVLYRLPEVAAAARAGGGVVVVEGEKDADAAVRIGFCGTTNAMGAGPGKWLPRYSESLRGAHVVILPDKDSASKKFAGQLYAEEIAAALQGVAASVRVIHLPGDGKDLSDWIAAGGTQEQLRQLIRNTTPWKAGWWTPPGVAADGKVVPLSVAERPAPDWPPIIALGDGRLPEFPVHCLPEPLQSFAIEQARAIQVPSAAIAVIALSACAAAVARKMRVEISPGYEEPLNLYTAIVMPPGERKSEALKTASAPLRDYELASKRRLMPEILEAIAKKDILDTRAKAAKAKAAKAKDEEMATQLTKDAVRLIQQAANAAVPAEPKLYTNNCTPEALTSLLDEHEGRMAVFAAEGGVFNIMAGQYSNGTPNFEVFLCGHGGDDIKVDRKTRASESILRPALTMCCTIQPNVLEQLGKNEQFRGRGLLARFLYAIPTSLVGWRDVDAIPINPQVRQQYHDAVRTLLELPLPPLGDDDDRREMIVQFGGAARELFREFRKDAETRLRPFAELGHMRDWGSKLAGTMGRLAAIVHTVENRDHPRPWERKIQPSAAMAAVEMSDFFVAHAVSAFEGMESDPRIADAALALNWIRTERRERFSARDLHQALRARTRFRYADSIEAPLSTLTQHGYIRKAQIENLEGRRRGPKPSFFDVNPMFYEFEHLEGPHLIALKEEKSIQRVLSTAQDSQSLSLGSATQDTQISTALNFKGNQAVDLAVGHPQDSRIPGQEG